MQMVDHLPCVATSVRYHPVAVSLQPGLLGDSRHKAQHAPSHRRVKLTDVGE